MKHFYKSSAQRRIAVILLQITLGQIAYPTAVWALTSGPKQPEFSGFQPVGVNDLVNKFTGDFTYSIPVMEVPGPQGSSYPVTLAYHSGASAEEEASWVGYGWNLSAGAINRNLRGLPDDFNNEQVIYRNKIPTNRTYTVGVAAGLEAFSADKLVGLDASTSIRYNNYSGFGYDRGIGISLGKGLISLGVSESDSRKSYSAQINPMAIVSLLARGPEKNPEQTVNFNFNRSVLKTLGSAGAIDVLGGNHGILDYNEATQATQVSAYSGKAYNIVAGVAFNPLFIPVGVNTNLSGSYAYQDAYDGDPNAIVKGDKLNGYGYLYSAEATGQKVAGNKNVVTDYYTEKDSPYSRRDVFLGAPFNNADYYNVTGDGVGGTFQLHHPQIGEFGPNTRKSETSIYNLGADVSLGNPFGAGLTAGVGKHTLDESSWDEANGNAKALKSFSSLSSAGKNKPFFRFVNDLGSIPADGSSATDEPVAAGLRRMDLSKAPLDALAAAQARPSQGAHIGQHTVAEAGRPAMFRYCKRAEIDALRFRPRAGSSASVIQNQALAEFSVVNESGRQYTYGLPVYARNESTMQYGVQGTAADNIKDNFLVYTNKTDTQVGESRAGDYATSYLLTEVTTPDYIDRNMNGPDANDFGSYVAFDYIKKYGGTGAQNRDWYHWRFPYTGHLYEANSLSDPGDDMGAVSEGDKEICYLHAVRTKTHTAIFFTSDRSDGHDALSGDAARNPQDKDKNLTPYEALSRLTLSKLDSIKLYANSDVEPDPSVVGGRRQWRAIGNAKPIKTVRFTYTYSLCPNTPNAFGPDNANKGKLTLVSISTAYNGVTVAKPYVFQYTYPAYRSSAGTTLYPVPYGPDASAVAQRFNTGYDALGEQDQNPAYDKFSLDAWGNYQGNGAQRYQNRQTWPDQQPLPSNFDPAAWQLKVIQLPSGGEIHVQYEPDDYAFVQDKTAHALASLGRAVGDDSFIIDPSTVGISTVQQVEACRRLIQQLYVVPQQKMYFKFLYNLTSGAIPNATSCNTDYISGYVKVRAVKAVPGADGSLTQLQLWVGDAVSGPTESRKDYSLPRQVCWDFVQTQRLGKLSSSTDCNPATVGIDPRETDATKLFRQFAAWATRVTFGSKSGLCAAISPDLSYFKIPLPTSKRGGGLRVKRLLTYDKGLDGVPVLYGSEYSYQAYDPLIGDWRSSGVATTEPTAMREENALVSFIPRLYQGDLSKIIAGVDRKQAEGPIGESVLPAAAVGYSRVTVRNIHSGKTNPGYSVSEFYTCKDAPVQWRMTPLASQVQYNPVFTGIFNTLDNNVSATQGFSFILNSMHGQPKREATYAGSYADINTQANSTLISEQVYQYFDPENKDLFRVQGQPEDAGEQLPERVFPGKDVDITMAQRAVRDHTINSSGEGDVQVGFIPAFIIPIPTIWITGKVSFSKFTSDFNSHTTSKVVRYPAIIKQVISFHDGVRDTIENLAFDRYSGNPVAVRTSDAGRGAYLKQDVMASWVYPQLQGKSSNEGLVLTSSVAGSSVFAEVTAGPVAGASYLRARDATDCSLLSNIRKGDVLALGDNTKALYFTDAPDFAGKRIRLYPYSTAGAPSATGPISKVTIVFSGNTNELRTQAGSTTYHGTRRKDLTFSTVNLFDLDPAGNDKDPLAVALQGALRRLDPIPPPPPQNTRTTTFTLPGSFDNVNVTGFAGLLPADCRRTASSTTIQDLEFTAYQDYNATAGTVRVQLISFKINCGGTLFTIR